MAKCQVQWTKQGGDGDRGTGLIGGACLEAEATLPGSKTGSQANQVVRIHGKVHTRVHPRNSVIRLMRDWGPVQGGGEGG